MQHILNHGSHMVGDFSIVVNAVTEKVEAFIV